MKKIALMVFVVAAMASCKKEVVQTPGGGGGTPYTSSFSYKKAGQAAQVTSVTTQTLTNNGFTYLAIAGNGSSTGLGLWLDPNITPGTYTLDWLGSTNNFMQLSDFTTMDIWTTYGDPGPSTLTIQKHDKSAKIIEGTFSGKLADSPGQSATTEVTVSDGVFKVQYK